MQQNSEPLQKSPKTRTWYDMRIKEKLKIKPISFRAKIIFILIIVVVMGSLVALGLGIHLFSNTVLKQARNKVKVDMNSALIVYNNRLRDIELVVHLTSERKFLKEGIVAGQLEALKSELERVRESHGLDVLTLTDKNGKVTVRSRYPYNVGDDESNDELVCRALKKRVVASTQIVPRGELKKEGVGLERQAYMVFIPTPKTKPRPEDRETSGMMLKVAVPVLDNNNNLMGALYGAKLLNRDYSIVDRIRDTVYKGGKYRGRDMGTATIFQWDLRISTNVKNPNGLRAIETRASEEVYDTVLENGKDWVGRAFVVNDWYIAAYNPIENIKGEVIGMLYVGILEQPFLDIRNNVIRDFLGIALLGVITVLILGFFLARSITRPIAGLVRATEEVSRGNLDYRVEIQSKDEFRTLGLSFDRMAKSLKDTLKAKDSVNEELRRSEEKYRSLFERVRHGIFISSKDGRFIDCNQAMLDMLGYANKEEFLALDIARDVYLNPKDREIFQGLIERDGFVKDFEVDFKGKDGQKITILLTAHVKRDKSDEIISYEGLNIDITERKMIEEKLKDLNTHYLEVLGFATHEIKQPLGILKGYLIMFRDKTIGPLSTDKQKQAVDSMLRSTNRLIDMSDKYLRLSKIETGELEITKKRFALFQEVINPLIRRETMNANEKGMKISVENRKGFERVEIEADPLLLDVVYTNLVSNALKYGREGGEISLGFKENEKGFTLSVRNEGEGIPQNKLEAVFEKFMRLDEKSPLRGSGLGLYNTREVIVRHGGKIWAESEQGKWVKFIFTLPKNQE